jgi:hypothetical protein
VKRRNVYLDGVALDAAHRGRWPYIWRFGVFQRALHGVLVVAFFLLAFTGLPLRFSCVVWAPKLMALWGGARTAGLIHRWAGGVVLACFAAYLGYAGVRLARAEDRRRLLWGPDSIILQPRDFREFWQMLRWSVGRAVKFRMEQQGLTKKDLEPMLGPRSHVSEVLSRKRGLSIAMIRKVHSGLGIPAEVLIRPSQKRIISQSASKLARKKICA